MKIQHRYIYFTAALLMLLISSTASFGLEVKSIIAPRNEQNPVRDVAWDDKGNIYVVATRWEVNRTHIKAFTPDGKPREDFQFTQFGSCCESSPLRITFCGDGYLYVLLPSKGGAFRGGNLQLIRIDTFGTQDREFGLEGVLTFPNFFKLFDFDISREGKIWILSADLDLYTFDKSGKCILVRRLKDIFPEQAMGGNIAKFEGRSIFALDDKKLLLFGQMEVSSMRFGEKQVNSALELDYDGRMTDHHEWDSPWIPPDSKGVSFQKPTEGKSFFRDKEFYGSILGFPHGMRRDEANTRALVAADWSIKGGFHFYNLIPIELPKEIFSGYDLNQALMLKNDEKTIVFFPIDNTKPLLMQTYGKDGKAIDKAFLDVYR